MTDGSVIIERLPITASMTLMLGMRIKVGVWKSMTCTTCNKTILFGGMKNGERRYCNKRCFDADKLNEAARLIPGVHVMNLAKNLHAGRCPKCASSGNIDIHKSYSIYSVIIYTKYATHEHLLCKSCASRQQMTDLVGSALFGWWGFPFGLIVTPIQIVLNVAGLLRSPGAQGPSKALEQRARTMLAKQALKRGGVAP